MSYQYIYVTIAVLALTLGTTWVVGNYLAGDNDAKEDNDIVDAAASSTSMPTTLPAKSTPDDNWHDLEVSLPATPSPIATTPEPVSSTPEQVLSIQFVNLPQQVKSNQPFQVAWQVKGPAGLKGDNTKLDVSYHTSAANNNARSSSSTESSQSFGSFTVPETFNANFTFGGAPGTVYLTITAEVNGQTLKAQDTIQLTN